MSESIVSANDWVSRHGEALRLMRARDWAGALGQIDLALAICSDRPQLHMNRAECLLALGRRLDACAAAAVAESQAPGDSRLADRAGTLYSYSGDQERAFQAYDRAVTLAPDNPQFIFNRATVRRFLGELDAAEADYDRVITLRPNDFEAYKNRSDVRTQTVDRNHVADLEKALTRANCDWRSEVQIHYAMAKEYEDLGNYERSFDHLARGAKRRREHLQYDVANDIATVDWIIRAHPRISPQAGDYCQESPIFVVGLPRSGTTLIDRILGSHSSVHSAGELNDFALAVVDAVRHRVGGSRFPRHELIARSADVDFAALGHDYMRRARLSMPDARRFTDKMPLNYLYCGLITQALPNARIVHLTRHPLAAGYAVFKTLFKDGYPFSYDLNDIAQYFIAYRRLMDHWRTIMPGVIHEVPYENMVADQLSETRKLLAFCGLDWQEACIHFHRNAAPTTSASASQVRRPMYASSVSQWRHYSTQLAPLCSELVAAGIPV
jgi:tetratricopeptide (TPR) repeat protein